jgi:HD-GYP domain-containing protein (c-di-GMP phosphodiesterase class II)
MDVACCDVYVRYRTSGEPVLYCRAGHPLVSRQLYSLAEAGVEHVYVPADEYLTLGRKLLGSIESFLHRDSLPVADRFGMLQMAASLEIENAARLLDCGKFVDIAREISPRIVELLNDSAVLPHDLFRVARHDYCTFTHLTNVACYAVVLVQRLGYCEPIDFERFATGAILHDIGKRFIPTEILTKPARLDSQERDLVESHPLRGYEELYGRPGIDFEQLMMVYQHHERIDGSGYPVAILADEIHPWAQLLAVVDVFEAMTGRRPYRRPSAVDHVLDYLEHHAGTHFNPEIVACWTSAMREA